MENKSNKKMSIGENKVFMGGVIIMLIVTLIVTLNYTLNLHVVVEKVKMFLEKHQIYFVRHCGITIVLYELINLLVKKRSFVRRILSSKVFMDMIYIVTMVLFYNYRLSIEIFNIQNINIDYAYVHGILMLVMVMCMIPRGDKMVRMSISLYSIVTIVVICISTLNLHIATIGQSTLFLDLEPFGICVIVVSAVIKYVLLKIGLYVAKWGLNKIDTIFKC